MSELVNMHVLVLPSFYPSPERPVTGIFFHEQALALKKAGMQVGVLVLPRIDVTRAHIKRVGIAHTGRLSRENHFADFPVYRMHWGWFPRFAPPIVSRLVKSAGLRAFEHYRQQHGAPDVIHAHNIFYGGYLAAQIKRKYGIPVVLTEHSTSYMEGLIIFPGQPKIIRETLRGVDVPTAVSPALADAMRRYESSVEMKSLGNIVDTRFFTPDPAELSPRFTFSAIGTLEPRKRYTLLLQAFAQEFKDTDVCLRIGGDGPLRERLEQEASVLGIQKQVTFLGRLTREQVRDELRRCHVHVSCSLVESFGVTLIEAMACGTPVIATRSGGPEGFVEPETGLLVPTNDVVALADAMRHMVACHGDYSPERIRAFCEARFSEKSIVSELSRIYDSLVERT